MANQATSPMTSISVTTRFISGAMIISLIIAGGSMLLTAPQSPRLLAPISVFSHIATSNTADYIADNELADNDVANHSLSAPANPDRSASCPQCAPSSPIAAATVQFSAVPPLGGLLFASVVPAFILQCATLPAAQLHPDPLEHPPAA